jgi:hypothetical protein
VSCETFDRLINLLLDGRLEQSEEKKLNEHLSQCKACREKLSFLQSIEAKARGIRAEEPPQAYWDAFSTRVTGRIRAREEKSVRFGLKRAIDNIFSYSPLKVKVAAGVISVVFVFIVGKLYVDYRGEHILPSEKAVVVKEAPGLEVAETKLKEEFPQEEVAAEAKPEAPMAVIMEPGDLDRLARERGGAVKKAPGEKGVAPEEEEVPAVTEIAEEKGAPARAPAPVIPAPVEGKAEAEAPAESQVAGAGADQEARKKRTAKKAVPEGVVQKAEDLAAQEELKDILATQVGFVTAEAPLQPARYLVDDHSIPNIREADTLMHADTLNRVMQVWKAHFQKHPADSLTETGYLQIATAYYLIARASQDTTAASEGSNLIEGYLKQVEDSATKEDLRSMLHKIRAIKAK